VHVGILGGGNVSVTHARAAAAAGCRIAAVWGRNAGKAPLLHASTARHRSTISTAFSLTARWI
jgi:hypothetical protein